MSKAQKIVNKIDITYGLDVSRLTQDEIVELIEQLEVLKDLDLDDVTSPNEDEEGSFSLSHDDDFGDDEG